MGFLKWLLGEPPTAGHAAPQQAVVNTTPQAPARDPRLGPRDVQIAVSRATPYNSWPEVTFLAASPHGIKYSCQGNDLNIVPYDQIRRIGVQNGILNISLTEGDEMYLSDLPHLYEAADHLMTARENYIRWLNGAISHR